MDAHFPSSRTPRTLNTPLTTLMAQVVWLTRSDINIIRTDAAVNLKWNDDSDLYKKEQWKAPTSSLSPHSWGWSLWQRQWSGVSRVLLPLWKLVNRSCHRLSLLNISLAKYSWCWGKEGLLSNIAGHQLLIRICIGLVCLWSLQMKSPLWTNGTDRGNITENISGVQN